MERIDTGERLETNSYSQNTIKHIHRYALASEYAKGKVVLDIASGEGYGSNILSQNAKQVFGVDIDLESVLHAKNKYRKQNLTFLEGCTSKIPLEHNTVDLVVSFETLEHHEEHNLMMKEIKRVLKPNGILIISTPDKKYYSDIPKYSNPFHVKELYKDEFLELLNTYFKKNQILSQTYLNGISHISTDEITEHFKFYSGDLYNIKEIPCDPVFLVAISSDTEQQIQYASLFNGSKLLNDNSNNVAEHFKNSTTYKVGKSVLAPILFLKRISKSLNSNK